ncbi:hypothetical protein [Providencia stuartii]
MADLEAAQDRGAGAGPAGGHLRRHTAGAGHAGPRTCSLAALPGVASSK